MKLNKPHNAVLWNFNGHELSALKIASWRMLYDSWLVNDGKTQLPAAYIAKVVSNTFTPVSSGMVNIVTTNLQKMGLVEFTTGRAGIKRFRAYNKVEQPPEGMILRYEAFAGAVLAHGTKDFANALASACEVFKVGELAAIMGVSQATLYAAKKGGVASPINTSIKPVLMRDNRRKSTDEYLNSRPAWTPPSDEENLARLKAELAESPEEIARQAAWEKKKQIEKEAAERTFRLAMAERDQNV